MKKILYSCILYFLMSSSLNAAAGGVIIIQTNTDSGVPGIIGYCLHFKYSAPNTPKNQFDTLMDKLIDDEKFIADVWANQHSHLKGHVQLLSTGKRSRNKGSWAIVTMREGNSLRCIFGCADNKINAIKDAVTTLNNEGHYSTYSVIEAGNFDVSTIGAESAARTQWNNKFYPDLTTYIQ